MTERFTHPPRVAEPRPTGGRLSTVGHAEAFRAFCRAARRMRIKFLLIGGAYRDVRVRSMSTRDIDVVLVDCESLPGEGMEREGFVPVEGMHFAWRYVRGERPVEIQIAAIASSRDPKGPFGVALWNAEIAVVEGHRVRVPRVEDFVVLKLLAAESDRRRAPRDLADIQMAIEAYPELCLRSLSIPGVRARLRDLYGIKGTRLRDLTARYRVYYRLATTPPPLAG